MKHLLLLGSLLGNFLLSAALVCVMYSADKNDNKVIHEVPARDFGSRQFSIGVIAPAVHPAIDDIKQGFSNTMQHLANITFYDGNGEYAFLHSIAEKAVNDKHDLLFTIGMQATHITHEVCKQHGSATPIIFGAVGRPLEQDFIQSAHARGTMTGIATDPDYHVAIDVLKQVHPGLEKMLIVYDPTQASGLERDKNEVMQYAQERGIQVQSVEVFKGSEIYSKVSPFMHDVQSVMVFKDHTVVGAIESLIKLCNEHKVFLYTSDLNSVTKGATAGFGDTEYDCGVASARCAQEVLAGKNLKDIPIVNQCGYKLLLNNDAMRHIAFELPHMIKFFITASDVYRKGGKQ